MLLFTYEHFFGMAKKKSKTQCSMFNVQYSMFNEG